MINADKLKLSAEKDTKKTYYRHTGYPAHLRNDVPRNAGQAPGPRSGNRRHGHASEGPARYAMIKKLKIYAGAEHPHSAQQPKVLDL